MLSFGSAGDSVFYVFLNEVYLGNLKVFEFLLPQAGRRDRPA